MRLQFDQILNSTKIANRKTFSFFTVIGFEHHSNDDVVFRFSKSAYKNSMCK